MPVATHPLTISEDQKVKLLKVIKHYFKGYVDISFGASIFPYTHYLWFSEDWHHPVANINVGTLKYEIHWFEFLMTQLIPAMAESKKIKPKIIIHLLWEENNFLHPVDCIYLLHTTYLTDK